MCWCEHLHPLRVSNYSANNSNKLEIITYIYKCVQVQTKTYQMNVLWTQYSKDPF